jgi:hypothetical protein
VSRLSRQCGILKISQPYRPLAGTKLQEDAENCIMKDLPNVRMTGLARYVAAEEQKAMPLRVVVLLTVGKKAFGRPMRALGDNVELDVLEMDCIGLD